MDGHLPTYDEAITQNHWVLVAPYICASSLCTLSRVNREFHQTFNAFLWGHPSSHFIGKDGSDDPNVRERVYVALTRFRRTLPHIRLETRQLTHTIHLPPAQAELYQRFRADWLREFLDLLPNLQSLLVSRLPLFDHSTLLNLRPQTDKTKFSLRLLDASFCKNATASGLTQCLRVLPRLTHLDLSSTAAARDSGFLPSLSLLDSLQVLKLRNVYLRDCDLKIVAEALKTRIRSLDVRNNYLTDQSVPVLLNLCFILSHEVPRAERESLTQAAAAVETGDWHSGLPYSDVLALDEMQDESYDDRLAKRLTQARLKQSSLDQMSSSRSGITHLRIADNNLSIDGVGALLRTKRLFVLDAGSPGTFEDLQRIRVNAANFMKYPDIQPTALASAQRLTPLLEICGQHLTHLRVDHAVVTKPSPADRHLPLSLAQLHLDEAAPDTGQPTAKHRDDAPPSYEQLTQPSPPLAPIPFRSREQHTLSTTEHIESQRHSLRQRNSSSPPGLLPGSLPSLRTLVLTAIPPYESNRQVITALLSFITLCAAEHKLADTQSQIDLLSHPRPHQRAGEIRSSLRERSSLSFFPLRKIVLEMAPPPMRDGRDVKKTKSSTEDNDSEAFWTAAEGDFSFFEDEGVTSSRRPSSLAAAKPVRTEAKTVSRGQGNRDPLSQPGFKPMPERTTSSEAVVDVVAEIAKFRRERKMAFEESWRKGGRYVDGYWPGEIQVVRPYG